MFQGLNLGKKIASQKKKNECSEENSLLQAKCFLGFVERFSEFGKGIY